MSLLFFLHSLNKPQRLASPRFTRRSRMQQVASFILGSALEPVKQKILRDMSARRRHVESCHFQLRAF